MSDNTEHGSAALDPAPIWWVAPDQTDWFAWGGIATFALAGYVIMTLYAKFDKWAEHKSHGTPLAKTIPTLLTIALLYEVFPLDHFHALLPITAILLALVADWMHAQEAKEIAGLEEEAWVHVQEAQEITEFEEVALEPQSAASTVADAEPDPVDGGTAVETVKNDKKGGDSNV